MPRLAFKMKLHPGQEAEYFRRHDELWPELKALLKGIGINEYSIFIDKDTNVLFGVLSIESPKLMETLPDHPVMKKWWNYMKDLMDCNPDNSPVSIPLKEVFYLE
ncbi:MAG: L-rhamnose mutarotase [Cytophagales bacterium]|nr:L-rhamnose mutarotase [Cytophagales bacterium]